MAQVLVIGGPTTLLEIGGLRLLTDTFSPAGAHESTPGRPLTKTEDPAVGIDDGRQALTSADPFYLTVINTGEHAGQLSSQARWPLPVG